MDLIILDLEWNTAFYPKEERFINEIIEFGAVKLDSETLEPTDSFQMFVKSKLSKRLRGKVKELTHITNEDLRENGESFKSVLSKFTEWAGENTLIMTWSNTDLHVMLDNCRSFTANKTIPFLYYYMDLQKYVQDYLDCVEPSQLGLSAAAEKMKIYSGDIDLHRATGDSMLCAKLLKVCYPEKNIEECMVYTRDNDFYDRLTFKPYIISDFKNSSIQPNDLRFKCPDCNNYMRRQVRWKFKNRYFIAEFECKNCKKTYNCRVQAKKLYDGVSIRRSYTLKPPEKPDDENSTESADNQN